MSKAIRTLKQEKNQLASQIKELKSKRKELKGYVPGLGSAQSEFRIKHIAHCILRGRTLEQIENKLRDPNSYEHKYVRDRAFKLVEKLKEEIADEEALRASETGLTKELPSGTSGSRSSEILPGVSAPMEQRDSNISEGGERTSDVQLDRESSKGGLSGICSFLRARFK